MASMAAAYGVLAGRKNPDHACMKRLSRRRLLAALFAAALPAGRSAFAAPVRLLVLGDSLAAGYGLARADGFQAQLLGALRARG